MEVEKPSREFYSMVIIMLRQSEKQTGGSFLQWLEEFEDIDTEVDAYDNDQLRSAIHKKMLEDYPPEEIKPLNPADFIDEDDDEMPETVTASSDKHADAIEGEIVNAAEIDDEDDEPLPEVAKLN